MIYRLILLCLVLFCPSSSGWAKEHVPFLGEISSDKVSVRAGQNVNFERVDILPKGTSVIVLDEQYEWYKVQLPVTAKVYIRVDYVTEKNQIGHITGNRLNVRAGRGVNFSTVGQLEKGAYIRLVSKVDDWYQIEPVEGLTGWIHKDFVKVKSPSIPSLLDLGFKPLTADVIAAAEKAPVMETDLPTSSMSVSVKGMIDRVPSADVLSGLTYRLLADDKTLYYLKVEPTIMNTFVQQNVRLEGVLVAAPASLSHPVIVVRKFQLIL